MPKILLVGGGTGGHIFPLRNLADELIKRNASVELVVADAPLDRQIVTENFSDITCHFFVTDKIRRYVDIRNISAPFRIANSIRIAAQLLKKSAPDAIFFKGGFVGFPILLAAKMSRWNGKIFTHESDISAGALTKFARRWADISFESFGTPSTPLFFSKTPGTAPTKEKTTPPPKKPSLPRLLVFGGSQGSLWINRQLEQNRHDIIKKFDTLVVTGRGKPLKNCSGIEQVELLPAEKLSTEILRADLIVARAGANSLFEIVAAKKPSVIIPLPSAARDHQRLNAHWFSDRGLCHMLEQHETKKLIDSLQEAQSDIVMTRRIKKSEIKNAAPEIAEKILKMIKKG